jgi:hypothetical protein
MFRQPIGGINSWNQDYQTLSYGNYGYGLYSQDVELYRNPLTGRINVEREIDFVPVGNSYFRPYAGFPAAIYQHYIS